MKPSIYHATAVNALALLLMALFLWNTQDTDVSQPLEQLQSEIESLRLALQEKGFEVAAVSSRDSHGNEIASPIMMQFRTLIREELASLRADNLTNINTPTEPLMATQPRYLDPSKQQQAEQSADAIVENILARQTINDEDYRQLMEQGPYLSNAAKIRLTEKLIMALNRQELQLQEPLLLPF